MRRLGPFVALLVFVAGLAVGPMAESDLFFRIEAGREIARRHALPGRNLYSFTYPDYPDIDTSWLFEVGAAAVHARGGFAAVVWSKTAVVLAAFAAAFVLCRRRRIGSMAAVLALAGAAYAARERFVERPHIFSLAAEMGLLLAIDALAAAEASRARRAAAALLALVVVWANLHAGVFVGVVLLALAAAGAALDGMRTPEGRRVSVRLALLVPCAAAATLVTPVGVGLYRYLWLHTTLPALHPVDEFRAASWISDAPLILYGAVALVSAVIVRPRRFVVLLPALGLAPLALRSIRFGADFALCAAPLVAAGLCRVAALAAARRGAAGRSPWPARAAAALLVGLGLVPAVRGGARAGLDESALPLDAIRFADENGLRERMYNDFEIGSYLLFQGYPRHRVFVDPRLPAYPPELHRLLGRADVGRAEWDAAMQRYGVDSALLAYAGLNRRVAWWDPGTWALVYRAHDARVFVRRLPRFRALIEAREIPATFSFTLEEGTATLPLRDRPAASPVTACEWQRRLGDLLFELDGATSARARGAYLQALAAPAGCLPAGEEARLASWLGAVELGEGNVAAALALIDRALARAGAAPDVETLANRALALEGLGRPTDAATAWAEVATRAAGTPLGEKARARARLP